LAGRGTGAFPKLRFVALPENVTRVLGAARMEAFATDELTMARSVVPALGKGMICLADRFFHGCALWQSAALTGAGWL
jgi:thymidylate kinase